MVAPKNETPQEMLHRQIEKFKEIASKPLPEILALLRTALANKLDRIAQFIRPETPADEERVTVVRKAIQDRYELANRIRPEQLERITPAVA